MPDYDINEAFACIEDELIASMFRNFKRHRAEEAREGYNWEMWQALQLKALDEYRRKNKKKFSKKFSSLNSRIDEFIRQARTDGAAEQEIKILEAVKRGYKPKRIFRGSAETSVEFIRMNTRKMDALIKATARDLNRAEHAMLRMANDQYRKIIFNAQVYAASGAGTYEKAVDMAAKDFLKAGINCIEYKNGARHTIRDYVSMVMATTGKRAYLTGEGEMRKQWGESLVIMNKRGNPCPMCAPFVGKVLVDDVWSGGKPDGKHMLMSTAIAKGLYHPRCKDGHTTYFEGISDDGEQYTDKEKKELTEQYNAEQKRRYAENQAEKYGRMSKYSLDNENKSLYSKKAVEWNKIAGNHVDKSGGSGIIKEETNQAVYKKFSTGEEVNKFFYYDSDNHSILAKKKSQYSQWVKNLSDETKDVIDNYSTDGYDDINRYWRKIGDWENINKDKVLYQTEKLDNAIASFELKDNLKVYRGVDLGTIANMFPDAEELTDLRGKIYSDKAFSSTSPISDVAKRFVEQNGQDGIMLELDIPSGTGKGAYLDALSAFGESIVGSAQAEYEFLLKRGAKFEIYDIDETNSFPILKGRWVE